MVHTKMCISESEMFSVLTYVTYENMVYPKLCYTRKYDVIATKIQYAMQVQQDLKTSMSAYANHLLTKGLVLCYILFSAQPRSMINDG